ncbi:hypothetical protein, unlikely [Trypanosoma congolense IL3000]|uniref:Uncharacterized protein n=1 Tax=Trypanosoma congolense (strain IL3000) TaxID=1068625 RepID=F9WEQ1_TRYCI|nr:hypothetical protein, unlikely [Trypanosoma congolense IL3000]
MFFCHDTSWCIIPLNLFVTITTDHVIHIPFTIFSTLIIYQWKNHDEGYGNKGPCIMLTRSSTACSHEKEDEAANIDEFNVSNIFDWVTVPTSFSFPYPLKNIIF